MFDIVFQKNSSETIQLTKNLETLLTTTGYLKESSSIIDPIIVVKEDLTDLVDCNYCTIDAFGRAYFINDIISVKNKLVEIHCHVDVLSSFANEIKANKGIVRRQEGSNAYNLYINDNSLVAYQDPYILTQNFPEGFTNLYFILAIASGGSAS